jgi:predicted metalloprotease with PDZ domain
MRLFSTFIFLGLACCSVNAAEPIRLHVDVSKVGQRLLHSKSIIPVTQGKVTLFYPKWIPGTHSPIGPIADLGNLRVTAKGKPISWSRDETDPYAIEVEATKEISTIEVEFDFLLPALGEPGGRAQTVASAKVAVINWCDLLLYIKQDNAMKQQFIPSITLPKGWQFGTALKQNGQQEPIEFASVSLETIIDSPLISGEFVKTVPIGPAESKHRVVIACDSKEGLELAPETKASWDRMVEEALILFGTRHYDSYTFLLALSDRFRPRGLEHHESSDNRLGEMALVNPTQRKFSSSLFPHEYVHSWCGKFRRPKEMIVPNFQEPQKTRLLWVYEGLTDYLAWVMTTRSGLWNLEDAIGDLTLTAERMENTPGRAWRSLEDVAATSYLLYGGNSSWSSTRRSIDFYDEGVLIWLDVDVTIRRESKGKKSIDDFCRIFFGGENHGPELVAYEFNEVVKALNQVVPYDWKGFLTRRVGVPTESAPLDGINLGGWKFGYGEKPSEMFKAQETLRKGINLASSLGLNLTGEGAVQDVIAGKPAFAAGIGPGAKIVAINGRKFSPEWLKLTMQATKHGGKLECLVESGEFFNTVTIDYKGGLKYGSIERNPATPDLLSEILKPLQSKSLDPTAK